MPLWPLYVSLLGLAVGGAMGAYAMLNPAWAARLVRLRDDPARPGGFAEFRGTYGGLFLAAHATAAFFVWTALDLAAGLEGAAPAAVLVIPACAIPASMWLGTSVGRIISILADKTGGGFNYASVGFEIVLGLMIAAPLWVFGLTPS